jgi:SH3 domain protein
LSPSFLYKDCLLDKNKLYKGKILQKIKYIDFGDSFMKKGTLVLFLTIALLFVNVIYAAAEKRYVSDRLEVVVRSGSSPKYRVISVVKADQEVQVIKYEGDYAFVKTARGKEGWVLKRFLTSETPKPIVIKGLNYKLKMLKEKGSGSERKMLELIDSVKTLEKTKKEQEETLKALEKSYQELKTGSANFLKLKRKQKELEKQLEVNSQKLSSTILENKELKSQTKIKWFMAGASAILIGFIIGVWLQRLRSQRRRQLSF